LLQQARRSTNEARLEAVSVRHPDCHHADRIRRRFPAGARHGADGADGYPSLGRLLLHAPFNPFVAGGIVLLIGFFAAYTTALSWADLTFVMPATAFGYVVIALLGRFWLHEHLSITRCIGIALIVCAVGFVAGGPSRTEHPKLDQMDAGLGPL
jgi:drug/metabolite transporter (DMT)-like permease